MKASYTIAGMTCKGCVNRVTTALENMEAVEQATIQLGYPQALLQVKSTVPVEALQAALGHYQIRQIDSPEQETKMAFPAKSIETYRPLLLIISFITGVTTLVQYPFEAFSFVLFMRHFMAGFFIVFSFFKLLNIKGFADSYSRYDLIAANWKTWGYVYPFVELMLGVLFLTNIWPTAANWITVMVLGISSIGVIRSVLNREQIQCACLGDVFNLPMSTVTIVEDVAMVGMAAAMLWLG